MRDACVRLLALVSIWLHSRYGATSQPQTGTAYQIPLSLTPGKYEIAIENCLGKGCVDYPLGWFTVTVANSSSVPTIKSIHPQVISWSNAAGSVLTISGTNFSSSGNYISISGVNPDYDVVPNYYAYAASLSSTDTKTISLQISTDTMSELESGGVNSFAVTVSNSMGTSNSVIVKLQ